MGCRPLSLPPNWWGAALVLAGMACSRAGDASPPQPASSTVLLITLDTTRADRLGAYTPGLGLTPRLDALAADGLVFTEARSTHPITLPAHASMLTGTYPSAHGVRVNGGNALAEQSRTLAEALSEQGFATGAAIGSFVLDARFGLDQGFDSYRVPPLRRLGQPLHGAHRGGREVVSDALSWLVSVPPEQPAFLWVHLFDAHFPYDAEEPHKSAHAHPYDAAVATLDQHVGLLLDGVVATGRTGPRLTLVVGDHGEGLGQHGEAVHGIFVYDSTLRVPLIVAGDGVATDRVPHPVSVADVAPTVLHWLSLPRELLPAMATPSLPATAAGRSDGAEALGEDRPIPIESLLPWQEHGWHPLRGLVWRGLKLVETARPELYDLRADPDELHDLFAERPEQVAALRRRLAELDAAHAAQDWSRTRSTADDERAALAALGYAGSSTSDVPMLDAPDAKDRLPDLLRREQGLWMLWKGRRAMGINGVLAEPPPAPLDAGQAARFERGRADLERAHALFAELLMANPGDPEFLKYLGVTELGLGEAASARLHFERLISLRPESAEAHFNLAAACLHEGEPQRAYDHMLASLEREPRAARATRWMAEWHSQRGQHAVAAAWIERLLGQLDADQLAGDDPELRQLTELAARCRAEAAAVGSITPGGDG